MTKKKLLSDLFEIVDRSRESAEFHNKEIENMRQFLKNLKIVVEKETPEFLEKFNEVCEKFELVLDYNQKIVNAESRTAEDLNDIAARFDVVFRVSDETMDKTNAVKKASAHIKKLRDELEVDRQKGGTKQAKLENDIRNAIEAKKKAIDEADKKLQEFIAVKEKYNEFKVRRLKHAYANLGGSIAELEKAKSDAYEQLRNSCIVSNDYLESLLNTATPEAPAPAPAQEQAGGSPFE